MSDVITAQNGELIEIPIFEDSPADVAKRVVADRPGQRHKPPMMTETIAALSNLPRKASLRRRVLDELAVAGTEGHTDFELWRLAGGAYPHVAGTRRGELVDDGLVAPSGTTRLTVTGTPAEVWRITPKGLAVLTELRRLDL